MKFEKSVFEIIQSRGSVRTYDGQPLPPETIAWLHDLLAGLHHGPFGRRCRLRLLDMRGFDPSQLKRFGTYGLITGTRFFIAGAVEEGPGNLEDFGYLLETAVLACAERGLGTCWLGGVLDRSAFGDELKLAPGELIPAVTPVGFAADRRSFKDRAMRFLAGSANRRPWGDLFFSEAWGRPLAPSQAGPLTRAFEAARLAPSASNKQPWRLVRKAATGDVHFYLEPSAIYARLMDLAKMPALQRVDLGIAMAHFELAARELAVPGRWRFEDPGLPGVPRSAMFIATWHEDGTAAAAGGR